MDASTHDQDGITFARGVVPSPECALNAMALRGRKWVGEASLVPLMLTGVRREHSGGDW